MYNLIEITNNNKVITKGTYLDCLSKFHQVCGFSFNNHKQYSYTNYDIIKIN
jgi:hypothetical protein